MRAFALLALAACGNGSSAPRTTGPSSAVSPTVAEAQPDGADDVVVATVNGKPVYGSCVAAQAAGHGVDARAALDQCVAFELLAQEAEARGLLADLDVADAWRRELVRAVIQTDLGSITSYDQLLARFPDKTAREHVAFQHRPEMRVAYFVRAELKRKDGPGSPAEIAAGEVMQAVYDELASVEGLMPADLVEVAQRIGTAHGGVKVSSGDIATTREKVPGVRVAIPQYRQALYEIPEIGRIHTPIRVDGYGWDVILWSETLPALDMTQTLLDSDLRRYFDPWTDQLAAGLGITYDIDDAKLAAVYGEDAAE